MPTRTHPTVASSTVALRLLYHRLLAALTLFDFFPAMWSDADRQQLTPLVAEACETLVAKAKKPSKVQQFQLQAHDHFWSVLSNLQCFRDAAIMPNHMHSAPSILYFLLEPDFDALPEALQTICLEVQDFAAMRIMQNTLSSHHAQAMLQIALANSEHSDSSFLRTVAGYFTHLPQPSDAALHTTLRDYLDLDWDKLAAVLPEEDALPHEMVNLLSDMFGSRDDPACPDLPVSVDTLEHLTNLTRQQEDCEKLQMQRAAAQQQLERLDLLLSHNSQQLLASADQVNQGLKDNNQSHATRDGEEDLNYLARTMTSLRMNLADEQPGAAAAADAVQAADMAQVNVNIELADQADQVDGAEA